MNLPSAARKELQRQIRTGIIFRIGISGLCDARESGLSPKWGLRAAMLPAGALYFYSEPTGRMLGTSCFQNGQFGHISSTLLFTMLQSSERHASARPCLTSMLPPCALQSLQSLTCTPKSHFCSLPPWVFFSALCLSQCQQRFWVLQGDCPCVLELA